MNLAPNGKPSNLTPEQYHIVRTPEFKAWFGDWENSPETASKVVDENGEPLVVYHSSNYDFNVFKDATDESIEQNSLFKSVGYYFTSSNVDFKYKYKKSFFLNSKNLVKIPQDSNLYTNVNTMIDILGNKLKSAKGFNEFINDNDYVYEGFTNAYLFFKDQIINKTDNLGTTSKKLAIKKKIDGFTFLEEQPCFGENMGCPELETFVLFNPNQIKLADGTNTTFDSNNADIRYKEGGSIKAFNYTIGGL